MQNVADFRPIPTRNFLSRVAPEIVAANWRSRLLWNTNSQLRLSVVFNRRLALGWAFRYGALVIGVLRFIGVLNAAVWFGAAVWYAFAGVPGIESYEMQSLLGTNYPYYSEAIGDVITARYFRVQLFFALIAVLHLSGEWLYLGKYPRRFWLGLLLGLCGVCVINGFWLQPKLNEFHKRRYGRNTPPPLRQAAAESFSAWHSVSFVLSLISVAGLGIYMWRMANPPDPTRFVSAVKFRS